MNDTRHPVVRSVAAPVAESADRGRRSFTLAELLVVMSIIVIISAITVVAVSAIAKDARLSSAKNSVVAALGNARALAMRNNQIVLVAFRAWPDGPTETDQIIEIVTAKWSGQTWFSNCPSTGDAVDWYVPISDVATRRLPRGVKVAAPLYLAGVDGRWATSTHLPAIPDNGAQEIAGVVVAVMFGPGGNRIMRNPHTAANYAFVDFNNDALQRQDDTDADYNPGLPQNPDCPPITLGYGDLGNDENGDPIEQYWFQKHEDDEPYIVVAPFLALFDDDDAREIYDVATWTDGVTRVSELTEFINERAERVHFNRYTGVVMR